MTRSIPRKGPNILALLLLLPIIDNAGHYNVFCNGYEVFTLFVWDGTTHSEQCRVNSLNMSRHNRLRGALDDNIHFLINPNLTKLNLT